MVHLSYSAWDSVISSLVLQMERLNSTIRLWVNETGTTMQGFFAVAAPVNWILAKQNMFSGAFEVITGSPLDILLLATALMNKHKNWLSLSVITQLLSKETYYTTLTHKDYQDHRLVE